VLTEFIKTILVEYAKLFGSLAFFGVLWISGALLYAKIPHKWIFWTLLLAAIFAVLIFSPITPGPPPGFY